MRGSDRAPSTAAPLPTYVRCGYALGDHTINVQLASVSLFFLFFLTEVAGLPPSRAGLVLLLGRAVDAFTDPMMGRISDATNWRLGRRRPYFLLGALPFGITFALLWSEAPLQDEDSVFAFYAAAFIANTLCSTVLAVPYAALLPEIAVSYDERTSLNTFRSIAVMAAILLTAVGMPQLVQAFGGGASGYAAAGSTLAFWLALPWFVVFLVTWERPSAERPPSVGMRRNFRALRSHSTYWALAGLFLAGRIAVDVSGAILLFYFTYWLGRSDDFPTAVALMLIAVMASLPVWLRLARGTDKRNIFIAGALWWSLCLIALYFVQASSPRWLVFLLFALVGIGYAVADLIPWAMLGDVIDEGELESGQRNEGIYAGVFTFVRKLGGALGVAAAGFALEAAGFERGGATQDESALAAIRTLTTFGPMIFLLVAGAVAWRYPLTRRRHEEILTALARRTEGEVA